MPDDAEAAGHDLQYELCGRRGKFDDLKFPKECSSNPQKKVSCGTFCIKLLNSVFIPGLI